MTKLTAVLIGSMLSLGALGEVTQVEDSGFVSEHILILHATPLQAYQALTADIHRWWNAEHSYSGQAENFSLQAEAGGCFCEALPNGGSVEHMRVAFAEPGKHLRLLGGLGPLQEMAVTGSMDFRLEAIAAGQTQLHYRYVVGGYVAGGLQSIASAVDQVQLGQLTRLQTYLATGHPAEQK